VTFNDLQNYKIHFVKLDFTNWSLVFIRDISRDISMAFSTF